jgi:predicted ArsR family transcriptional regulator
VAASRQRIIVQLKKSGEASVSDLSRELGLTSVTVRHHLQELRLEGLVDDPRPRRRRGPGRPEMTYRLFPEARVDLPRNYQELCVSLVERLSEKISNETLSDTLSVAGQSLGRASIEQTEASIASRTERVEAFLEERGYFPRWSQVGDGMRLHLANCPYREIAEQVPEMCSFDKALLAGLTGTNVRLEASIATGAPACCFLLAGEPLV